MSKWLAVGVPAERLPAVSDLAAATDLLQRYLKPGRTAAVVRRPAKGLGGISLIETATRDGPREALAATRAMFDFDRIQS
ncbi:MAG: hypothetical protein ACYDAC_11945 [Candidatus Dormibacteria bacterium]